MKRVCQKLVVMGALIDVIFISGCATMFNSGSQTIMARSTDGSEGIKVEVASSSGAYPTKLPATISAEPSHKGITIQVADRCYDSTRVDVNKSVTPSFWANLLWGYAFPIGMGVDAITGKMWKYDYNVAVPVNKRQEC